MSSIELTTPMRSRAPQRRLRPVGLSWGNDPGFTPADQAAGKKLTLYLSSTSLAQNPGNGLYVAAVEPGAQVTIGRATLRLSVLTRAVSR